MWLADVAMYWVVGEYAFELNLPVGAYFLLEGIGNLALAVPATAAGIGTFDYLTLLAAKGIEVNPDKATAYVLTMHALAVIPVTLMGAILVSPAFPRLLGRRREPRAGIRLASRARVLAGEHRQLRRLARGDRERLGKPAPPPGRRPQGRAPRACPPHVPAPPRRPGRARAPTGSASAPASSFVDTN